MRRTAGSSVDADAALNIDVVKTVFQMTADGFDFPYGDVALLKKSYGSRVWLIIEGLSWGFTPTSGLRILII